MSVRLLLVDDEPNVVHALLRVMRRRLPPHVKVEVFDDPCKALARARAVHFAVVVSDFRMPQMNGILFLQYFRDLQPHAIRLILSASTEVETVMSAINDVQVFRYLTKPWHEDELVAIIEQALIQFEADQQERTLADQSRLRQGLLSPQAAELRRLEALEPGITHVQWGPQGEVIMDDALLPDLATHP